MVPGGIHLPYEATPKMIASAKVHSVIKGEAPDIINIEYYGASVSIDDKPRSWHFTQLKDGEISIAFLRKEGASYKFCDPENGKLVVEPQFVEYDLSAMPLDRLLSELVFSAQTGKGFVKLQAIEQIGAWGQVSRRKLLGGGYSIKDGVLGESQARVVLRELRSSNDLKERAFALIAGLEIGDSPGVDGAMSLFAAMADGAEQQCVYERSRYPCSISNLQERFIQVVDDSTRTFLRDANGAVIHKGGLARGVSGFDYPEFCKQVLQSEPVRNSVEMRKHVANTIWILEDARNIPDAINLLSDSDSYVRYVAVGFLQKTVNKDASQFVWETYQAQESDRLQYWRKWWQANRSQFNAPADR